MIIIRPRKLSLSGYTSSEVKNFQILSPLHPSGKPYLSKSEACRLVKLVGHPFSLDELIVKLVGFKLNCSDKIKTALLSGYKVLKD